jgi:DNA-binding CsgD family transcriptional regulator/Tfp pilus assembly protein PilF
LLGTFRDDEVGATHPLSRAIGDLTAAHVTRLRLPPLSRAAVAELAAPVLQDGERVYTITGGNPFFVRELLSAPLGSVPATVRDSMLARLARCSAAARQVSEIVALVPGRMEIDLLDGLAHDSCAAIEESIERGILIHERHALAFRHELARRAVEDSISPVRAIQLHAAILAALVARGAELGRIVHHARLAGAKDAVLKHAPVAAARAAAVGAHREAAAYYAAALECSDLLESRAEVELLERHAYECYLTSQIDAAVASALRALEIWRALGERQAQGRTLRFLSRQHWFLGNREQSERYAGEAIAMHEAFPPDRDLAMAYSNRAQLAMLGGQVATAVEFGERAIAIAHELGDVEIEAHALNNIGTAQLSAGNEEGRPLLERSLALALEQDLHEHVARAYVNLATSATSAQQVERASSYLRDGIAYCEERDLESWTTYLKVYRARFDLDRGAWDEAAEAAQRLVANAGSSAITRIPALVVLAQVRMRRGQEGVSELLDEALAAALPTGELQRIGRVCAARAEQAWYAGDEARVLQETQRALEIAQGHRDAWITGELLWLRSHVADVALADQCIAPAHALAIAGDWRAAAAEFERLQMPHEQAIALLEGDAAAIEQAAALIDSLGAVALTSRLDAARRARGRRRSTLENPQGLTNREIQVLRLLGRGYTNAQLADKLCVSPKTIDHHVSAILGKLQVRSRAQAVTCAFELGLVGKE